MDLKILLDCYFFISTRLSFLVTVIVTKHYGVWGVKYMYIIPVKNKLMYSENCVYVCLFYLFKKEKKRTVCWQISFTHQNE